MKKYTKILSILILTLIPTGCWNYSELNEIAITTGIAIDIDDDKYKVTALISNGQKQEGSAKEGESQITAFIGTGKTISEGLKNIELKIPKEIYLRHISTIIIGEDLAKNGIKNILDYFIRDPNSPNKFNILIAKDAKAGDVLKIISPLESFPSQNIDLLQKTGAKFQGISTEVSFNDFIKAYLDDGINPVLSSIEIKGEVEDGEKDSNTKQSQTKTYVKLGNLAIFRDDKFLGYAKEKESIGINIMMNKIEQIKVYTKCENSNKYIVANLTSINSKTNIDKNKKVTVKIDGTGYIAEANCDIDLTKEDNIKKIEKQMEKEINNMIKSAIKRVKEYKSDVFGLGNLYYKKYPKEWNNMKEDWDKEVLPTIDVNINSNVRLKTKGTSNKTIEEVHKENE